mgnify:CR=1 FL=1
MTTSIDPAKQQQMQAIIGGAAAGALTAAMISLGMRLGLYAALDDGGAASSDELAARTGLHERWLREWLYQQASARILEHDGGRFSLPPEARAYLSDERSLSYMGSSFLPLPHRIAAVDELPESFRTGIGMSWDDRGAEASQWTELLFRNWYEQVLVPGALPLLEGAIARLEAGTRVADIGCGTGIALLTMARAFPASSCHGYEISEHALGQARENARAGSITNATFHNVREEPLRGDHSFGLITTFDCLHDMTDPAGAAAAIRAAIAADGVWLIADINGQPTFEENARTPLASTFYAMSVLSCMSSALSEPGGAGLGTLGLPEPAMRELTRAAGFTRFRRLDLKHPVNAFYEARP